MKKTWRIHLESRSSSVYIFLGGAGGDFSFYINSQDSNLSVSPVTRWFSLATSAHRDSLLHSSTLEENYTLGGTDVKLMRGTHGTPSNLIAFIFLCNLMKWTGRITDNLTEMAERYFHLLRGCTKRGGIDSGVKKQRS